MYESVKNYTFLENANVYLKEKMYLVIKSDHIRYENCIIKTYGAHLHLPIKKKNIPIIYVTQPGITCTYVVELVDSTTS